MHLTGTLAGLRWLLVRICVVVTVTSIGANFLPHHTRFARWPRLQAVYLFLVDYIALLACNWRASLPSLESEIMGFKRNFQAIYQRFTDGSTKGDDQ